MFIHVYINASFGWIDLFEWSDGALLSVQGDSFECIDRALLSVYVGLF